MIDVHCHVIPGIDDGPAELEDALALARACAATGVTHVFATPHVFPGRWDNRRSTIRAQFELFKRALQVFKVPLELGMAGEVRLNSDVLQLLADDELPFLGESDGFRTMLLELPDASIPVGSDRLVRHLLDQRIRPLIVHPERNKAVMEDVERIRPFVEMGCDLQLTAASVIGEFGAGAHRASARLLKEGWVTVVASDAHNLRGRPPRMDAARAYLVERHGELLADELTRVNPARLCGLEAKATLAA